MKYLLLLLLAGCMTREEAAANKVERKHAADAALAESGADALKPENLQYVGTLPDGRAIQRAVLVDNNQQHFIYFAGEDITVNDDSRTAYVMINGERMTLLRAQIKLNQMDAAFKAAELARVRSRN